jgi:hypothetical protein
LTYIEAQELAFRYHARLPVWQEDDELIDDWVDLIAQLPAAEQQGRLAQAIAEADRYAGALSWISRDTVPTRLIIGTVPDLRSAFHAAFRALAAMPPSAVYGTVAELLGESAGPRAPALGQDLGMGRQLGHFLQASRP